MIKIAESTFLKISWGALVGVLTVIIAFAAWMTSIDLSVAESKKNIEALKINKETSDNVLNSIDRRLQRIEILLEETIKNINKEK